MAEQKQYKCPACGGEITFDPHSQNLKCPYCDTEYEPETLYAYDEQLGQSDNAEQWDTTDEGRAWEAGETDGMRIYVCNSCGGEIIAEETTGATTCPYCGSPTIMTGQFAGDRRPDLVIPFQLDKKAAKEGLKKHLSNKKLLPAVFKDENHIDEIKGLYVPVWLFDTVADGQMRFRCTRSRVWQDRRFIYTETKHYSVQRGGTMPFGDIPVDGSSKMADELMESIEPFDLTKAVDFQTAYLSGYLADTYDVPADTCMARAKERVKATLERCIADTVRRDYDSATLESTSLHCYGGRVRYALYPVWVLHTSWQGKDYLFAMNGQSGKFVGDLPMDKAAWWKWFGIYGAAFSAAVYGLGMLMSHM